MLPVWSLYVSCDVSDLINQFQIESILILTAVLLKKRIVMYHPKIPDLLATVQ